MRTSKCPYCGEVYRVLSGGHCIGGKFDGCCRTFASDAAGDRHRPVGKPCLDVTTAKGWRQNRYGEWTDSKPMDARAVAARRGGLDEFADGSPGGPPDGHSSPAAASPQATGAETPAPARPASSVA